MLSLQEEKHLELALLRLFYNERDIDEITEEINRKNHQLEKENRKKDKIEDEIKDKKKDQGKLARELTKVESKIKESVCSRINCLFTYNLPLNFCFKMFLAFYVCCIYSSALHTRFS